MPAAPMDSPGPTCLIVEDEYLIRVILVEALADDGFVVVEATDVGEAIAVLEKTPIDLLLTDVQLPGERNGLALARWARQQRPDLPVIYMTGRPDSVQDLDPSGREALVAKPYLPSEICAAARRLTGR